MTDVTAHIEPDTREKILITAERLFREIGYQKTTVADIAKALQMSPANVYRFFDSKRSINKSTRSGESSRTAFKPKSRGSVAAGPKIGTIAVIVREHLGL